MKKLHLNPILINLLLPNALPQYFLNDDDPYFTTRHDITSHTFVYMYVSLSPIFILFEYLSVRPPPTSRVGLPTTTASVKNQFLK